MSYLEDTKNFQHLLLIFLKLVKVFHLCLLLGEWQQLPQKRICHLLFFGMLKICQKVMIKANNCNIIWQVIRFVFPESQYWCMNIQNLIIIFHCLINKNQLLFDVDIIIGLYFVGFCFRATTLGSFDISRTYILYVIW